MKIDAISEYVHHYLVSDLSLCIVYLELDETYLRMHLDFIAATGTFILNAFRRLLRKLRKTFKQNV